MPVHDFRDRVRNLPLALVAGLDDLDFVSAGSLGVIS
jgi:hypothetical protein